MPFGGRGEYANCMRKRPSSQPKKGGELLQIFMEKELLSNNSSREQHNVIAILTGRLGRE